MSEAKFTKGEWKIYNERVGVFDESDSQLRGMMCEVAYVDMYNFGEREGRVNAHLIACAPDMYREIERDIERLTRWIDNHGEAFPMTAEWKEMRTNKIELLKRARGE